MATVGSLIINVGANIAEFQKKMGGIGQTLQSFAGKVGIAAGFTELAHKVKEAADEIARVQKLANMLGTSREFAEGLTLGMKQLGQDATAVGQAMRHLQKDIGEAGIAGSEAAKKFEKFGIDTSKFGTGDFQGTLGKIADAINAIPDPAQRAAAKLELLSRHGMEMAPILALGSKGMEALAQKAALLGGEVNEIQGQKVLSATKAWKAGFADAGEAISGVYNRLAVLVSGPMEDFGKGLSIVSERFAGGMSHMARGFSIISHGFDVAAADATIAKEKADAAAAEKRRLAVERNALQDQAAKKAVSDLSDILDKEALAHTKVAHAADFEKAKKAGATEAMLAPLRAKAELESFRQTADAIKEQIIEQSIAATRMPEKIDAWKAAQAGLTKAHQEEIEALGRVRRLSALAYQTFEETRTPLELFNRKLADQRQVLAMNVGYWDTYQRSIGKAGAELIQMAGLTDVHLPGAAEIGSREAYSIMARSQAQERDPARMLEQAMKQLAVKEDANKLYLERIARAVESPKFMVVSGK